MPCSTTTIALEFMREIVAWTESRPALLQPARVGSGTRCHVSPGNVAATGWAMTALALGAPRPAFQPAPRVKATNVMTRTTRTCDSG